MLEFPIAPVLQHRVGSWLISTIRLADGSYETITRHGKRWSLPISNLSQEEALRRHDRELREILKVVRYSRPQNRIARQVYPPEAA